MIKTENNSKPVTVVITCNIKPNKIEFAKKELEANIKLVMDNEPGCYSISVRHDPEQPHRMLIIEKWESIEIFNGPHMQTPHMQTFLKTAEEFLDGVADFSFWQEIIVTS